MQRSAYNQSLPLLSVIADNRSENITALYIHCYLHTTAPGAMTVAYAGTDHL